MEKGWTRSHADSISEQGRLKLHSKLHIPAFPVTAASSVALTFRRKTTPYLRDSVSAIGQSSKVFLMNDSIVSYLPGLHFRKIWRLSGETDCGSPQVLLATGKSPGWLNSAAYLTAWRECSQTLNLGQSPFRALPSYHWQPEYYPSPFQPAAQVLLNTAESAS